MDPRNLHHATATSNDETISRDVAHLLELLKEFSSVMVGTLDIATTPPSVRARPMNVAKIDADCSLYFITDVNTQKVDDATMTRIAYIFAQGKTRYVSLSGRIEISQDRALIRELWSKVNDAWFDGPEDPRACVLIVHPEEAELWDLSGRMGMKYMLRTAKALLTGKPMSREEDEKSHETVKLNH